MNMNEILFRVRRSGPGGTQLVEKSQFAASAIDLYCVNSSGGNLVGQKADPGSDWVNFDLANWVTGDYPRITKAPAADMAIGAMHWAEGTIANGKAGWVRIFGMHDYAKVVGNASAVAGSIIAVDSSAGQAVYSTQYNRWIGYLREAYTTASVASKKVFINNPLRLPLA